jgi:hypothetical protein
MILVRTDHPCLRVGYHTVGDQGDNDTTTAPSKGKGKPMWVIASDDEVSSDDNVSCRGN